MFHLSETTDPCTSGIAVSITDALELKQTSKKNKEADADNLYMDILQIGLLN